MLRTRILVLLVLIPALIGLILVGGWIMDAGMAVILEIAAWEYWKMFTAGGYEPSRITLLGGVPILLLTQRLAGFDGRDTAITFLVMFAMAAHLVSYEKGAEKPATNLGITIGGLMCIGWLGSYILPLRDLPEGVWWTLLVVPSAMLADAGGYIFGRWLGSHKLCPRLSPKKTWEGFFGGVLFSLVLTSVIAMILNTFTSEITLARGLIVALVMSVLPTFGDLGMSMIKRQCGVKDAGNILPGHGGILDRFDSVLWCLPIGFYLITWLWMG